MADEIKVYVTEFGDRAHYQLQWRDPITHRLRTKSSGVSRTGLARDRKLAERIAGEFEAKLNAGEAVIPSRFTWHDFRKRYEAEVIPALATRTAEKINSVLNRLELEINPRRLWDVDERSLSFFAAQLRKGDPDNDVRPLAESTIAGHLAHIKAAMNWAKLQKLIPQVPTFPRVKRAKLSKGGKVMRGRPITTEEFERMLGKVQEVVGENATPQWTFYLRGLWTSGLRLAESLELYWDRDDKLHPVLTGRFPMLRIPGDLEKGNKDRLLPMAPEFARLLLAVPEGDRSGPVFKLDRIDGKPGQPAPDRVSKIVSSIGSKAKVRVDAKKTASAHDLRRAFGERWASRLMPAQLMELMRHESIETTMSYYVGRNAERTAAILWHEDEKAGESQQSNPTVNRACE